MGFDPITFAAALKAAKNGITWESLPDRPFGDLPTGGDTLTWDGNTEGLVGVECFYKVSDATLTMDDLVNGCTLVFSEGSTYDIPGGEVVDIGEAIGDEQLAGVLSISYMVLIYPIDIDFDNGTSVKKGTYFSNSVDGTTAWVTSLTIPGYTGFPVTKKLDEKYLPGAVVLYTDGTYLYNSEDTTDESNRTTKAELWELYDRGRVDVDATALEMGKIRVTVVSVAEEDGLGYAAAQFVYMGLALSCYTAEYTPETS